MMRTRHGAGKMSPMGSSDRVLRPFWLHQAAEYLIGLILVAQGLQSPTPLVPSLAGALVIVNGAVVDGPLGAFRLVSRPLHRTLDIVVIGVLVVLAALPWFDVDNTSRLLLVVVAAMLAYIWWHSSFQSPLSRAAGPPMDRSEAVGRAAGKVVGGAVRAVRDRRKGP
jgi:hypothetical protein